MASVLVTGGSGRVGKIICPGLVRAGHEVTSVDLRTAVLPGVSAVVADFDDVAAMAPLLGTHDVLVHLAGEIDAEDWDALERTNIRATRRLFVAAAEAGTATIIYASSIHAAGYAPLTSCFNDNEAAAPDSPYGVSKRYGEAMLQLIARRHGVVAFALRIGTFRDRPLTAREAVTWLSHNDAVRLFDACITAKQAGYRRLWAFSGNAAARFDRAAWNAIGYVPQDDAEHYRSTLEEGAAIDARGFGVIGGRFVQ